MTEQPPPLPPVGPASGPLPGAQPAPGPGSVDYPSAGSKESLSQRPEVKIAATFAGGLVAATILKRLVR